MPFKIVGKGTNYETNTIPIDRLSTVINNRLPETIPEIPGSLYAPTQLPAYYFVNCTS